MPAPTSATKDRWTLSWSLGHQPPNNPLPKGLTRSFVDSPNGPLELLTAKPSPSSMAKHPDRVAIVFQHGGFGCAEMYLEFLLYFAACGYPSYALSVRGHGHSWRPGWFRLSWLTSPRTLATDLSTVVKHVQKLHGREPILLGHSNGGGLSQLALDAGMIKTGGLVILAGTPNFGAFEVYRNWAKRDAWFVPRFFLRDLWHPRSPLSSTTLVHRAFFCDEFPREQVRPFERLLSESESMLWAISWMRRFVDTSRVLAGCNSRLLVMAPEKDKIMTVDLLERMANEYKSAARGLVQRKKADEDEDAVEFKVVQGAGHHAQNDLQWEDAARMLEIWLKSFDDVA